MTKRILALLLVLVMVVALAACGAAEEEPQTEEPKTEDTKKDEPKEEPKEEETESEEPYTIVWYYGGTAQPDIEMVQEAMAEYYNETYGENIALDMVATPYGDLQQKMSMVFTSGEKWDLCFTSTWSNNFAQAAGNGAYLALDELLPEYAPEMYDYIGGYWGSVTMDGHIWAIPNIQVEYKYAYTSLLTKYVEMYNATNPEIPVENGKIEYIKDLDPFFMWCKDNIINAADQEAVAINGKVPKYAWFGESGDEMAYLQEDTGVVGTFFEYGDESLTVKRPWDFELRWNDALDTYFKWYNEGLTNPDYVNTERATADLANLMYLSASHPTFLPGQETKQHTAWGLDQSKNELTFLTYGEAWAYNGAVTATLTAVNAKCERPDIVLKFLNALNTDPVLYNICCFGIEGYHYEVVDGCVVMTEEHGAGYNPNNDWGFGNQFNAIPRKGEPADIWEQTMKMNESCKVTCAMGFQPKTDNIVTQVANCSAVNEQYNKILAGGGFSGSLEDWHAYKQAYIDEMTAAGIEDIIADVQAQVDAWAAVNK